MDEKQIAEAIKSLKKDIPKKNFIQSIDLIVTLQGLDPKKAESKIEEHTVLPNGSSKPARVAAFIGGETKDAGKHCTTILDTDFSKYDKRKIKSLARNHEYFISQANIMPEVAKIFGKFLAPIGKMPNPKFGHVFPPKANIKPLVDRLQNTVILSAKKAPVIQCSVGNEKMEDGKLAENIKHILNHLEHKLPAGKNNIGKIMIKTTMGRPIKL